MCANTNTNTKRKTVGQCGKKARDKPSRRQRKAGQQTVDNQRQKQRISERESYRESQSRRDGAIELVRVENVERDREKQQQSSGGNRKDSQMR